MKPQRHARRLPALLLALLAASPLLNPVFDNFIPPAQASGPEAAFLDYMKKVLSEFTSELQAIGREFFKLMGVPPEKIADHVSELGVVLQQLKGETYTWDDIGLQYKVWAEKAVEIMKSNKVLTSDEANYALDALQGARGADAVIAKAGVLKGAVGGGAFGPRAVLVVERRAR
jgi:hypothetical protein